MLNTYYSSSLHKIHYPALESTRCISMISASQKPQSVVPTHNFSRFVNLDGNLSYLLAGDSKLLLTGAVYIDCQPNQYGLPHFLGLEVK